MPSVAVRNNNPGNLMPGGRIIWPGQIGQDASGYAIFNSYDAGVAAADANLQSYGNQGIDTPYAIAHRWSTTDQQAYTDNMASALGVSANTPLDLTNPTVRNSVLQDIFHQEDSSYVPANPFASAWTDIQAAAQSGNPIDIALSIFPAITKAATNVVGSAAYGAQVQAAQIGTAVNQVKNFDLGQTITNAANGAVKSYAVPVAIGAGALLLVMFSAWGLVKDTPVGQVAKTASKAAFV